MTMMLPHSMHSVDAKLELVQSMLDLSSHQRGEGKAPPHLFERRTSGLKSCMDGKARSEGLCSVAGKALAPTVTDMLGERIGFGSGIVTSSGALIGAERGGLVDVVQAAATSLLSQCLAAQSDVADTTHCVDDVIAVCETRGLLTAANQDQDGPLVVPNPLNASPGALFLEWCPPRLPPETPLTAHTIFRGSNDGAEPPSSAMSPARRSVPLLHPLRAHASHTTMPSPFAAGGGGAAAVWASAAIGSSGVSMATARNAVRCGPGAPVVGGDDITELMRVPSAVPSAAGPAVRVQTVHERRSPSHSERAARARDAVDTAISSLFPGVSMHSSTPALNPTHGSRIPRAGSSSNNNSSSSSILGSSAPSPRMTSSFSSSPGLSSTSTPRVPHLPGWASAWRTDRSTSPYIVWGISFPEPVPLSSVRLFWAVSGLSYKRAPEAVLLQCVTQYHNVACPI